MDIQFKTNDKRFNCRVSGICIKENKFFLTRLPSDDFWTFVGGKVAFDESTDIAVIREFNEETGVCLQIERLLAIIENFFDLDGYSWHQYIFFYNLKDENNLLEFFDGERKIDDEENAVYKWFDLSELDNINIKPSCSKEILKNLSANIQHYIVRDNQ